MSVGDFGFGLVFSVSSGGLQTDCPIWLKLQVMAASAAVQLPAGTPGRAAEDGAGVCAPVPSGPVFPWEIWRKLLIPRLVLAQPLLALMVVPGEVSQQMQERLLPLPLCCSVLQSK